MSSRFDTNSSDVLFATAGFATSQVNVSYCFWEFVVTNVAAIVIPDFYITNSGTSAGYHYYRDNTDLMRVAQDGGAGGNFTTLAPYGQWNFKYMTAGTAGANSVNANWCDNSTRTFSTLLSLTGIATFTPSVEAIGQVAQNGLVVADFYNYIVFNGVLTAAQMLAQSKQVAPITGSGLTVQRWIRMDNAATAGTDYSGNGNNMTISGTLTDGASNPTFPGAFGAASRQRRAQRIISCSRTSQQA